MGAGVLNLGFVGDSITAGTATGPPTAPTQAPAYTPKVRDMIARGDGTKWSVQGVKIVDMGARFVCECIQERS